MQVLYMTVSVAGRLSSSCINTSEQMSRCHALVCRGNRDTVTADWGPNHHDYLLYVSLSDGTRHGRGRHLAGDTLRSTLCGQFALTANMSAVCCTQCADAMC